MVRLSPITDWENLAIQSREKIGSTIPRTYKNGSKCLDHVYVTTKVYDSLEACGIAPFDYFQKSDHRGIYIDLNLSNILDTDDIFIQPAKFRRLKLNSVASIKKYEDNIFEEMKVHKFEEKIEAISKLFQSEGVTDNSVEQLNKLDDELTSSMLNAEKKCSKIHMNCRCDWSPQLKFVLRNYRWAKNNVKKIKREGLVTNVENYNIQLKKAFEEQRKWKAELRNTKKMLQPFGNNS